MKSPNGLTYFALLVLLMLLAKQCCGEELVVTNGTARTLRLTCRIHTDAGWVYLESPPIGYGERWSHPMPGRVTADGSKADVWLSDGKRNWGPLWYVRAGQRVKVRPID